MADIFLYLHIIIHQINSTNYEKEINEHIGKPFYLLCFSRICGFGNIELLALPEINIWFEGCRSAGAAYHG